MANSLAELESPYSINKRTKTKNHHRFTYMQFLKSLYFFYCNAQWLSCLIDDPYLHGKEI